MAKNKIVMDFGTVIGSIITGIVGLLSAIGLLYKTFGETDRENKKAEAERKRAEQEAIQKAFQSVTDAQERQIRQLTERVDTLEDGRHQRDVRINELERKQEETQQEVTKLRQENESKDEKIAEQGKRIQAQDIELGTVKQKLTRLEQHLKDNGFPFPEGWENGEK